MVGVTGLEPATSRPPAVRASQTAPHPENAAKRPREASDQYDNLAKKVQVGVLITTPRRSRILNSLMIVIQIIIR